MMPSDKVILTVQVTGFLSALAILFFLHGWTQALFAAAFSVHFAGDLMRLKKDGLI